MLFLALGFPYSLAQSCLAELQGDTSAESFAEVATGRDAAQLLKRAVDVLEPVMPAFPSSNLTALNYIALDDPAYKDAEFLAKRYLLPAGWRPDELNQEIWSTMLKWFSAWYDLDPPRYAESLTKGELIADLEALINLASPKGRAVALVAANNRRQNDLAFLGLIRLGGVYPRLIVVRPPLVTIDINQSLKNVFPYLENCAIKLENYIYAPSDTARQLFLAHNDSKMYIVALAPEDLAESFNVPLGDEVSYFEYQAALLAQSQKFVAVFEGRAPNPLQITRMLPQIRTNMGPREILSMFGQ
ncbi:MAG: hypothetical protein R2880_03605 [Deinococcales bacterium]